MTSPKTSTATCHPPTPAEVAAQVRASAYVQQCRRLVEWVGTGRQVTPKQVLRLAPAREAYAELDLWAWQRAHQSLLMGGADLTDGGEELDREGRDVAMHAFRSAADCQPLDRLWLPCDECDLIDIGKTKAVSAWSEPATDEEWRLLGTHLIGALVLHMSRWSQRMAIGTLLLLLGPARRDGISIAELQDWWWEHEGNFYRKWHGEGSGSLRPESDDWLLTGLYEMSDTGVWRREGDRLHSTALGHDVALVVTYFVEMGIIEE